MGIVVEEHDLLVCPKCLAVFRTGFRACPRDGEPLQETRTDPLIGKTFADRYQIESLIGEGGIGRVYKARHARMSRRYALKIPYGEVAYDPKVRARFANEAEAASRLSHVNVVGVVDFGETDTGLLYMAMDYAEGKSLAQLIGESGPLERSWVIRFTRDIAEGLAHAHDRGLIHRDLKPDNIIIETNGDRPRIVDFGLAIFREQEGGRMTTQGTVLGTPHYMAPEQATGQEIEPRTDLFSLGLCMYEMLAGVLPFEGTPIQVARRNLSSPVPLIADRVPGLEVDPALEALCHHMLSKRAEERPPSAHAVVEMLNRLDRGDTNTWQMDRLEQPPAPAREHDSTPISRAAAAAAAMDSANTVTLPQTEGPPPKPSATPPVRASEPRLPAPAPVQTTDDIHALIATDGRKRALALVAALAVLAVAAIVVWRLVRSAPTAVAVTPTPDAATVAIVVPDAAVAEPALADAALPALADAAVAVALADAAPRARPDAREAIVRTRPDARSVAVDKPDARTVATARPDARPVEAPKPDAAPVVAQKTVEQIYKRVGEAIERLRASKGDEAAKKFKDRLFDLPYGDALGNPALRPELIRKLEQLERELKRVQ
jgi:eukaryotic-like serine/threonine-protein kinase